MFPQHIRNSEKNETGHTISQTNSTNTEKANLPVNKWQADIILLANQIQIDFYVWYWLLLRMIKMLTTVAVVISLVLMEL